MSVKQEDWLAELALGNSESSNSKGGIVLDAAFSKATHAYTAVVPDYSSTVYAWIANVVDLTDLSKNMSALSFIRRKARQVTTGVQQP